LSAPDRGGVTHQDKKGGLIGILYILFLSQNLPAGAPDKAPVPFHQERKGGLIPVADKALQQLGVAQRTKLLRCQQTMKLPERNLHPTWHHPPSCTLRNAFIP